jgi:hypothetical protein
MSVRTPTTRERIIKWVAIALSVPVVLWGLDDASGGWLWPDWLP